MSATGFQRRRRELAKQTEQQTDEVIGNNDENKEGSGNSDNGSGSGIVGNFNLAGLSKADLLKFAGKRKLLDKSLKELEPAAIIPIVIEKARGKIVEAGLKTAEEADALSEYELFALFDTIGK